MDFGLTMEFITGIVVVVAVVMLILEALGYMGGRFK